MENVAERFRRHASNLRNTVQESLKEWKNALPLYAIFLTLYVLFLMIFPSAGSAEASLGALKESSPEMGKLGGVCQSLQNRVSSVINSIGGLSADKIANAVKSLPKVTWNIICGIPAYIGNLFSNISKIISNQGKSLKETLRRLWPPGRAWKRLKSFAKKHGEQISKLTGSILSCLLSFCALKLFALFVVPFLGLGAILFLGIDISLFVLFLLNQIIAFIGRLLGEILHGRLSEYLKKGEERHEALNTAVTDKLKQLRSVGEQQFLKIGSNIEQKRDKCHQKYTEVRQILQEEKEPQNA